MKVTLTPSGKMVGITTENGCWRATVSLNQADSLKTALRRHVHQRSSVFTEDMKIGVYGASAPECTVIAIRGHSITVPDSEAEELADALDDILRD